ncbi:MAG: 50S ribosomal protein L11 methyltransferase [Methylophaga sp.]|nr:50S ribosomal protein L11 methyltransferase [Methylophaga sp.]
MPWIQVIFCSSPADAEQLSDVLSEAGASAVTFEDSADQPIYEPALGETPLWSETRIIGLFDAAVDCQALLEDIATQLSPGKLPDYRIEAVEDKDWEREWMDNFHPMCFGERLWIVPSWRQAPDPEALNILLDPGLAFGTGTHPTTALCLEWLDTVGDLTDKTVIDYGCGSGILAIAAGLLGAKRIIAVDNDPQALEATQSNAERNEVTIETYLPQDCPTTECDLLLANILAGPLHALAPLFAELTTPSADLVLSGILDIQAEQLKHHYEQWFTMQAATFKQEWTRLTGKRHA